MSDRLEGIKTRRTKLRSPDQKDIDWLIGEVERLRRSVGKLGRLCCVECGHWLEDHLLDEDSQLEDCQYINRTPCSCVQFKGGQWKPKT